jgi:hypothetical protein
MKKPTKKKTPAPLKRAPKKEHSTFSEGWDAIPSEKELAAESAEEEGGQESKLVPLARIESANSLPRCPQCNGWMRKRSGSRGEFWGCTGYPDCKGTRPIEITPDFTAEDAPHIQMQLLRGSPQQEAVFDSVQIGMLTGKREASEPGLAPHGVVQALAGTGKTWTIIQACLRIPRKYRVAVFSYNTHIIAELNAKFRSMNITHVLANTSHSYGWAMIRRAFPSINLEQDKTNKAILILEGEDLPSTIRYNTSKLVGLCKNYLMEGTYPELEELVDRHGLELDRWAKVPVFALVPRVLNLCLSGMPTLCDFDDQIYWPVKKNLPVETFDYVFLDEAQDTNKCQQELLMRACPEGRVFIVGDTNQCQPPDSMISATGRGPLLLGQVKEGDELVSFNSPKTYFPGTVSQGRKVEKVVRRHYKGLLIKVLAAPSGYESRYTPEHRCLVRLTNLESYAVYAMLRGSRVRVGMCRLMYPGNSGIALRARCERADAAWILSVERNQEDALLQEEKVAALFGLSQTIFENTSQISPSQEFIESLYTWLERHDNMMEKLQVCLKWFGRRIEFPIWCRRGSNSHVGRKTFVTQACNLTEGMLVKVFDGNPHDSRWEPFSVTSEDYDGEIISLQVEPAENGRRLYVADGIVTHNSVYGFRGADVNAMPSLETRLKETPRNVKVFPLTITRRCPKSHVALAKMLVPDFEALPDAPEGVISFMGEQAAVLAMKPGDLVMCRVNRGLVPICYQLIRRGVKAIIRGRDIGKGLTALISRLRPVDVRDLLDKLSDFEDREISKLSGSEKNAGRIMSVQDRCDCLREVCEGETDIDAVRAKILRIFSDFDDDGKPKDAVTLGSIHKSKGLESTTTYILLPELLPHPMARQSWETIQERNLAYVAMTRAKFEKDDAGNVIHPGTMVFVGDLPPIVGGQKPRRVYPQSGEPSKQLDLEDMFPPFSPQPPGGPGPEDKDQSEEKNFGDEKS